MPDHTKQTDDGAQYHYNDIRPGDIVHDIGQMGWPRMRVLRVEAHSARDYLETRGIDLREYDKNALVGTSLDDPVFLATYLQDSPMGKAKTHYPVPASRLAKQDLMGEASHVDGETTDFHHPADQAVLDFLTDLLTQLKAGHGLDPNPVLTIVRDGMDMDPYLVDEADDVSQARVREARDTTQPDDTDEGDGDGDDAGEESDDELGDFDDFDS